MREFINIVENTNPSVLYHGTSLDDLCNIIREGVIHDNYQSDGWHQGVSLSRSFEVSRGHGIFDDENMTHSFYDYFGLEGHENYKTFGGSVLAFDKDKIQQKLEHVDDQGDGSEEEERTHGSLPLKPALIAIYVSKPGLQFYINEVNRGRQESKECAEAYGPWWDKVIHFLTTFPNVKGM